VIGMAKRKSNHVIPGMNAAKGQGVGAGFNEELASEPELNAKERMNNKKRKKNQ
jgi:small acid-soluble spore protein O (minor)